MQTSSDTVAALVCALSKAQGELTNPERSSWGTISDKSTDGGERNFRYASLASGLDILRTTLARHELAVLQTTSTNAAAKVIELTTILAHSSGEWISSQWPVCGLEEVAAPRRMGAALTYARRYSLFTLVGIAGEDDLDAPNGALHVPTNLTDETKKAARGTTLERFGKGRRVSPHPLDTHRSSVECQRLVTQIESVNSEFALIQYARDILKAKNSLTESDATKIDTAFASRLTLLKGQTGGNEKVLIRDHDADTTRVVVDKSVLKFSEPRRLRSKAHLKYVAGQSCLICERKPCDAHHLRFAQPRALGRKVSDEYTVPICRTHHEELHRFGDERAWWASKGIDSLGVADSLWRKSRLALEKDSNSETPLPR